MIKLDPLDIKILGALQNEGRMTKVRLAETVGLSVSPCWERLRRLERQGVISGYRAEIDLAKVVKAATVWVEISLKRHHQEDFEAFERTVLAQPEIVECWATGGTIDYLMRVIASDLDAYQVLMERLLAGDIGIDRYVTCVVTKAVKRPGTLPIAAILGAGRPRGDR